MRKVVLAASLALAIPVAAHAQRYDDTNIVREGPPKVYIDFALDVGQSTGEFSNYVNAGIGIHGGVRFRPDPRGPLSLRVNGNFMMYGSTTSRYPLVPGITVDVTTTNGLGGLTLGPELALGSGSFQPYVFGGVGFEVFATTSAVEGSNTTNSPFASTTNHQDATLASEGGAGLRLQLGHGRTPVFLDLGARYLNNGRVTYVTRDGLSVVNNEMVVRPIDSEANLIVYHLGVSIGARAPRKN